MDLIARYLHSVRRYLPRSSQDDVVAELSDSIQSRVEDEQERLGRPLTDTEQSAILKSYGHPIVVAARYRPHQQLIGPALYPFYLHTLRVVLSVTLGIVAVVGLMQWAATGNVLYAVAHVWEALWGTVFAVVGIVTVIFAAIERFKPMDDYTRAWDPRTLPPVDARRVARSTSIVELIFNLAFAALLLNARGIAVMVVSSVPTNVEGMPFALGPWWHVVVLALLLTTLVHAGMNIANLLRPDWARLRSGIMAITHAVLAIVTLSILATQHGFVSVASGIPDAPRYASAAQALNGGLTVVLLCFVVISAITAVVNARKTLQRSTLVLGAPRNAEAH